MTELLGILNINKPRNFSSRSAIDQVKVIARKSGIRKLKLGHAGTLDPIASGVLVACIGKATRLIDYIQHRPKTYLATFLLDAFSDTDDIEKGYTVMESIDSNPNLQKSEIEAVLPEFTGEILQAPPAYSAVKVNGKRAYRLARAGEKVELEKRTITIHRLEIVQFEYPKLQILVQCGSGTYIRSLGRDIAKKLGTHAVMSELVRTAIGEFTLENSISLNQFTCFDELQNHFQPAIQAVSHLPSIELEPDQLSYLEDGREIRPTKTQYSRLIESIPASRYSSAEELELVSFSPAKKMVAILKLNAERTFLITAINFHSNNDPSKKLKRMANKTTGQ